MYIDRVCENMERKKTKGEKKEEERKRDHWVR